MTTKKIKIAFEPATEYAEGVSTPDTFRVVFVKNSTEYMPGQTLTRGEVDALCNKSTWDVTLVRPLSRED